MKKYSICSSNIMEKKGKEEFVLNKENVMLLKINKYNAYIMLDDIKNVADIPRISLELGGIALIKKKYYYASSYDKFVDEQSNNYEVQKTGFIGLCKYLKKSR